MKTEDSIKEKRDELQTRYSELHELQTGSIDRFHRELNAYALWSLKDQIAALDWVLEKSSEL